MLALTATASKTLHQAIATTLRMNKWELVRTSVDRPNIYLSVKLKQSSTGFNHSAVDSFLHVIEPLFNEFKTSGDLFPKTVLYCTLNFCGIAYEQAVIRNLSENVAMYYAQCTSEVICTD